MQQARQVQQALGVGTLKWRLAGTVAPASVAAIAVAIRIVLNIEFSDCLKVDVR